MICSCFVLANNTLIAPYFDDRTILNIILIPIIVYLYDQKCVFLHNFCNNRITIHWFFHISLAVIGSKSVPLIVS